MAVDGIELGSVPIEGERLHDPSLEWLEADGLGGFALGTVNGIRTRRYHGLLCAARTPPTGRVMLVSAVEAWIDLGGGPRALSSHRYAPGVTHPDGARRLVEFRAEPCPAWTWALEDDARVEHELFVPRGSAEIVLVWRLVGARRPARLTLRPLLALRDVHALRREDPALDLASRVALSPGGTRVRWRPDSAMPGIVARSNGVFRSQPLWYRSFLYEEERARGYDHVEDLASPGYFEHELQDGDAVLTFVAETPGESLREVAPPAAEVARVREEREHRALAPRLERSAEAYLVRRGGGRSIIAGYPWFTDWGRDTFLSLRGLLLARGRAREAAEILATWSEHVSRGMLPNRFPDGGDEPEYNSVDASLWYVVAAAETLAADPALPRAAVSAIERAARAILAGYAEGTRHGIRADADGLLACGEPGTQLTWMDAKVGDRVMTPRIGKPVEVQALWIRALEFGARLEPRFRALAERARAAFEPRFWNESAGYLNDVVDCDHVPGTVDGTLRPNQALAVGGLGPALVSAERARRVVEVLERELWTPLGLRTLARSDPRYVGRYEGGPLERDRAYHQGAAWAWLLGPFVEAWVGVQGESASAKAAARARFLAPLRAHLGQAGLGHVSELADGDPPHVPRGCPFQAWSLAELLRLELAVLAPRATPDSESSAVARAAADRHNPRMAVEIRVAPHPSLRVAAFVCELPGELGALASPPWLAGLLALDAEAPVKRDEATREAVRDLLRHGGYKPTGRGKPSSEYLVRAVGEGALGSINLAVDACNAVSLASGLPISVVDLSRARGPFRIDLGARDATYVFNASGQTIDVEGLLCLFDVDGPCANAVKDAQRTKTGPATRRTLSVVWGCEGLEERLAATERWYRALLERAGARTESARLS